MAEGPILLIFDFPHAAFGPGRTEALKPLAESIAREPGLLWKIWTENTAEQRAGGVYLFETRAAAEAYHRMHAERLGRMGVTGITASYRTISGALTHITRGPVPA